MIPQRSLNKRGTKGGISRDPDYHRKYYAANRERLREYYKRWREANPYVKRYRRADYRELIIAFLCQRDKGLCGLCGGVIVPGDESIDHIIPRAQDGPNTPDNVRLAHKICNMRRPGKSWSTFRALHKEGK